MKSTIAKLALLVGSGVAVLSATSCGGSDDDGGNSGMGGNLTGVAVTGVGGVLTGSGGSNSSGGTSSSSCTPSADASGCVGESYEGEAVPLDIYVMFDLSCSMSCTVEQSGCCLDNDPQPMSEWRIEPVRQAMRAFLQDPASAGIGVGLGFFGDHNVDTPDDPAVCTVEAHSDATVDIQQLPGAANTLIGALDAGQPQGGTPTHLAIDGACNYAGNWKQQNPAHKVVILLVTDGIPEYSCNANIQQTQSAAEDCYDGGQGIETYVLGVVANNNNSLDQLNSIAEAGGTDEAYLTDANDVAGSVLEALNAIRADAVIPCDLRIPPPPQGETLNPNQVNIGVCDAGGSVLTTPQVPSQDDCGDSPGWYYDDPDSPETIHLCEITCGAVQAAGTSLFFSVGCDTVVDVE